jgi:hypothetical protein
MLVAKMVTKFVILLLKAIMVEMVVQLLYQKNKMV